jgi:hypothetical protein
MEKQTFGAQRAECYTVKRVERPRSIISPIFPLKRQHAPSKKTFLPPSSPPGSSGLRQHCPTLSWAQHQPASSGAWGSSRARGGLGNLVERLGINYLCKPCRRNGITVEHWPAPGLGGEHVTATNHRNRTCAVALTSPVVKELIAHAIIKNFAR